MDPRRVEAVGLSRPARGPRDRPAARREPEPLSNPERVPLHPGAWRPRSRHEREHLLDARLGDPGRGREDTKIVSAGAPWMHLAGLGTAPT